MVAHHHTHTTPHNVKIKRFVGVSFKKVRRLKSKTIKKKITVKVKKKVIKKTKTTTKKKNTTIKHKNTVKKKKVTTKHKKTVTKKRVTTKHKGRKGIHHKYPKHRKSRVKKSSSKKRVITKHKGRKGIHHKYPKHRKSRKVSVSVRHITHHTVKARVKKAPKKHVSHRKHVKKSKLS